MALQGARVLQAISRQLWSARLLRSRMGAPRVAGRILLQAVNEKRSAWEMTYMLKAEHAAGPLRGSVGTVRTPAVLASGASRVSSSQIMGELDYQAVEATYRRGK